MYKAAFEGHLMELAKGVFSSCGLSEPVSLGHCAHGNGAGVVVLDSAGRETADYLAASTKRAVIIANADDFPLMRLLDGIDSPVISCGMSARDSITSSSMEQEGGGTSFVLCIQRSISDLNGNAIEPQEFGINIAGGEYDISKAILICTAALVCGSPSEALRRISL